MVQLLVLPPLFSPCAQKKAPLRLNAMGLNRTKVWNLVADDEGIFETLVTSP